LSTSFHSPYSPKISIAKSWREKRSETSSSVLFSLRVTLRVRVRVEKPAKGWFLDTNAVIDRRAMDKVLPRKKRGW